MMKNLLTNVVAGLGGAIIGAGLTYVLLSNPAEEQPPQENQAQNATVSQEVKRQLHIEKTLEDTLGRVVSISETERPPGHGSTPHSHPGSHNFGYVVEGTYEVQVDDGPVQRLGPGEVFYESPGALHAVSRNGSSTEPVRYLIFKVADPSLPSTVR
jgi:quercetin dioxygenase-like cupin family protein